MRSKDSFKHESFGSKIVIITTVALMLMGSVGLVVAAFYFGIVGLFNVLGVEYDSLLSLVWFTLFYFLLGIIGDIFIKVLLVITYQSNKWSARYKKFSIIIYSFLVNWGIVSLLNQLMSSVDLHIVTQIIFACIIAVLDFATKNDKYEKTVVS